MTTIALGLQVFQDLGQEFMSTVFGTTPSGKNFVTCGVLDGKELQSEFHLNPFVDGECAGVDLVVLAILIVIVHTVSWLPRYLLWEPLANWRMQGHKTWDHLEAQKFSQTATSLLFFCSSSFFVWRILSPRDWLYSREGWFNTGPLTDADFRFYYLLYSARFLSDLVSIFFEDRKRDAFIASFVHHIVTIGLVLGSAHVGLVGYGGIIMFFFDWADIPLLSAKLFKYLSKDPNDFCQFAANRLFETFAVCFFLTRNCFFNYVVYCVIRDLEVTFVSIYCEVLLVALVILQTYWMYLVVKAVQRQQQNGGVAEDVREKDD